MFCEVNSKIFFLHSCLIVGGDLDLDKYIFSLQIGESVLDYSCLVFGQTGYLVSEILHLFACYW